MSPFLVNEMADPLDDYLEKLLGGADGKEALDAYLMSAIGSTGVQEDVNRAGPIGHRTFGGQPSSVEPDENGYFSGRAATFATPSDLADWSKNKSLVTGDNGRGAWGADTTKAAGVAIPRDLIARIYGNENAGAHKLVRVIAPNGNVADLPIVDKGPKLKNRHNNALFELTGPATQVLGTGDTTGYKFKFL